MNFFSPPTNQPSDAIVITSHTVNGFGVDTCTEYVSDLIPQIIGSTAIDINSNTGVDFTVNTNYTMRFSFVTVETFGIDDYFEI